MLQSEAPAKVKMSLSAQGAAKALARKMATGVERQQKRQMPPQGRRRPTRAGAHSLYITLACPWGHLSSDTLLSAPVT